MDICEKTKANEKEVAMKSKRMRLKRKRWKGREEDKGDHSSKTGVYHAKLAHPNLNNEMKITFNQILQEAPVNNVNGVMTLHDESSEVTSMLLE